MRTAFWFCARMMGCGAVVLVVFISQHALADAALAPNDQALQLVQRALLAEADGKPDDRATFLQQALSIAPDFAPAHWQSGEIRTDNQWTSIDDAVKHDAHSAKLDEYRKLRDQAGETVDDQLNLARWCEKAGLKEQQRAHLTFALELEPNNKEAISKLGLVSFQHHLVPASQLDDIKIRIKESTAVSKVWKDRVDGWQQQLKDHPNDPEVLKQIRAVRDPAAIYALNRGLAQSGQDACLAVVDALAAIPQQAATESLLRIALFSSIDEARRNAVYALKERSPYSYVPILLSAMQSPIFISTDAMNPFASPGYSCQLTLFQEGPVENKVNVLSVSDSKRLPSEPLMTANLIQVETVARMAREQRLATGAIKWVQSVNQNIEERNSILASVLETTTDQQLGNDASNWWSWWYEQNDYYLPPEKPTNITTAPIIRLRASCFVAGTPVWTTTGPMQIEKIKVGELVLAQNTETGELAYKPVIGTTIRPASPLIETRVGETLIRSTRGHPFWVAGTGWQMAKELKAGEWLHTVHGPVQIESAEPSEDAVCYNLVVADFHNYFVSAVKVLVHDNLLRGPTMATVPGLAEAK
jgi:Pretoxin HINT domain